MGKGYTLFQAPATNPTREIAMPKSAVTILALCALAAMGPRQALAAQTDAFDAFAQPKVVGVQQRGYACIRF